MRDVKSKEAQAVAEAKKRMSERKRACTRKGVLCGHRRALSSDSGGVAGVTMCYFLLDTGCHRDCPPGKKCKYYTTEQCRMKRLGVYEDYI